MPWVAREVTVYELHGVDEQSGVEADGEARGYFVALDGGGDEDCCRGGFAGGELKGAHCRGDDVVVGVGRLHGVDSGGSVARQLLLEPRGQAGGAHHDGSGFAQPPCGGKQFEVTLRGLQEGCAVALDVRAGLAPPQFTGAQAPSCPY